MPHICMDEIMAFMMLLPWVGGAFLWVRMKFRSWRKPVSLNCDSCQQHVHHPCCEYNAAMKEGSDWAGNHPVSCTCEEEESRDRQLLARSTYR